MAIEKEKDGNLEAAKIIDETRHEVEALKEKTKKEISGQIMEASNQVKDESEALVLRIMEKILDRRFAA
jgi:F0F1-type ATP synthase membrane subunit b/b'